MSTDATDAPAGAPSEEVAAGAALVPHDAVRDVVAGLEVAPAYDRINPRQLQLLKQMSPNVSEAELAMGLELAFAYQLDPYAREVWFVKSRPRDGREGRLLIMVGRDGIRKIVQRNGLDMDCDVVHQNDVFSVKRAPDRSRVVTHEYGAPADRGPIVGAWAEVWERATGIQRGFFYAPIDEFDPRDTSGHSPWSKQRSVMIMAAAERQAGRQATPLGGLLVEGEDDVVDSTATEVPRQALAEALDPHDAFWQAMPHAGRVIGLLRRASAMGHGLGDVAAAQMALGGQDEDVVAAWCDRVEQELDDVEAAEDRRSATSIVQEEADSIDAAEAEATLEDLHERANAIIDELAEAQEVSPDRVPELEGELERVTHAIENRQAEAGGQASLLGE